METTEGWNNKVHWASVLENVDRFYLNVVGDDRQCLEKMKATVSALKLKYENKIAFNFTMTVGRGTWSDANSARKTELIYTPCLSEGEVSTVMKLHEYCTDVSQRAR